jgi:hypothetical protein
MNTETDKIRQQWVDAYPGKTDNGLELPIERVRPGVITHGVAIGYLPAANSAEAEAPWTYHWANPTKTDTEPLTVSYSRAAATKRLNEWMVKEFGHPLDFVTEPEHQDRWYRDNGLLHRFICELFPESI